MKKVTVKVLEGLLRTAGELDDYVYALQGTDMEDILVESGYDYDQITYMIQDRLQTLALVDKVQAKLTKEVKVVEEKPAVKITDMQKQLLQGFMKSEYHSASDVEGKLEATIWSFSMIANSGLEPMKAAGALASLKSKGIVSIGDLEKGDVRPVALTLLGRKIVRELEVK